MTLEVGIEINGYRIEELLSSGGMGAVYRATQLSVEREVALKTILDDKTNSKSIERFKQEARVLARISHPHVIQVLDLRESDDGLFIAMELVTGTDLLQRIKDSGPLDESVAREYLKQCASALAAAHDQGIIHRDIKPSNLMLTNQGTLKVTDFGIAKSAFADTHITRAGALLGTPDYMPPEQIDGNEADARSDIYALGASFYHLISGKTPFKGKNYTDILVAHKMQEAAPLSELASITPEFNALILSCLHKRPEERPQSMREVMSRCDRLTLNASPIPTRGGKINLPCHLHDLALIEFLARERRVSRPALEEALGLQRNAKHKQPASRLGKILLDQNVLSEEELAHVESEIDQLQRVYGNQLILKLIEKNHLLNQEQCDELQLRHEGHGVSLMNLIKSRGWLSEKRLNQLEKMLLKHHHSTFNRAFGQLAVAHNLLSEEVIQKNLKECEDGFLAESLMSQKALKEDEVRALLDVQKLQTASHFFSMDLFDSNLRLRDQLVCPHCGHQVFADDVVCRICKKNLRSSVQSTKKEEGIKAVEEKKIWFVKVGEKTQGPISLQQVQMRILNGKIPEGASLKKGPQAAWVEAIKVPGVARTLGICYKCGNFRQKQPGLCELCGAEEI